MLIIASYELLDYGPICLTQADSPWRVFFFATSIVVFYVIPCVILIILYSMISKNLMKPTPGLVQTSSASLRYRKQVILMLGTVVISFFVLLLPFRLITLFIIFVPTEIFMNWFVKNYNVYLVILYSSRILIYLNSAINPILYNLMSSKFRTGFYKLFMINNRFLCASLFCTQSVSRRNTMNSSLVTTTTTNVTSSSVIKHQYSISSVHSTQSHSVSARKHARHSVVKTSSNRVCTDDKLDGSKRHHCHYCSKQIHVNIEDLTKDSEDDVDRSRFVKNGKRECDIARESCSSGDDEIMNHLTPNHSFESVEETSPSSDASRKRAIAHPNCPVCKIFNKFVNVNSTCEFIARKKCSEHEHDKVVKCKRSSNILSVNLETPSLLDNNEERNDQLKNLDVRVGESSVNIILNDKVDQNNVHIDRMNVDVNNSQPILRTRLMKVGIAKSERHDTNPSDFNQISKKAVSCKNEKKILRRRSTYDLFVDKICSKKLKGMTNNSGEHSNYYLYQNFSKLGVEKVKPLKAVSLDNDNQVVNTHKICKEMSEEKFVKIHNRNKSIDEEFYTNFQQNTHKTQEHDLINHNQCKQPSEKDMYLYKKDINNYVNFELINQGLLDKLKQKNIGHSMSLHDSFRSQNGTCYSCLEYPCSCQTEVEKWKSKNEAHKQTYAGRILHVKTQRQSIDLDDIDKTYFDEIEIPGEKYVQIKPSQIESKNYYILKNGQTYHKTDFQEIRRDTNVRNSRSDEKLDKLQNQTITLGKKNGIDNLSRFRNQIETLEPKNKVQENDNVDRQVYFSSHDTTAQICSKCSNKNKKIIRRKSFDLSMYNSRKKLQYEKYSQLGQAKQDNVTRRKSCDFEQIVQENCHQKKIDNFHAMSSSKKQTLRSWSNESIADRDLCSIFENPMTAYHSLHEERLEMLQGLNDRSNSVTKDIADLVDFRIIGNRDSDKFDRANSPNNDPVDYKIGKWVTKPNRPIDDPSFFGFKEPNIHIWSSKSHDEEMHTSSIQQKTIEDAFEIKSSSSRIPGLSKGSKRKLYHSRSFHSGAVEDTGIQGRYTRRLDDE